MTLLHSGPSVCIEAIRKTIRPSKSQTRVRACCFIAAAVSAVLASAVPALAQRSTPIQLDQWMGASSNTLDNTQSTVYYDTLENNGTIQAPGNITQNPPCPADFNLDGGIDGQDIEAFFMAWEAGAAVADTNGDGGIDGSDVATYFISWESGGC